MSEIEDRLLLDALADPVVAADTEGRVVYINAAAETLTGWRARELRGQPLATIVPDRLRVLDGQPFHAYLAARSLDREAHPVRTPALRKDGVEVDVDVTAAVVRGPDGAGWLVASLRRIADSVESDGAVPQVVAVDSSRRHVVMPSQEESHRLVFENAPIGILHFDRRGVITACNDVLAKILGSSRRTLVGANLRTLEDRAIVDCARSALGGTRARYEGDYKADGRTTAVRVDFNPIHSSEGALLGGVGIVEDVSERKAIQSRLQQADRMASVGTLAAGVAHEINNPLAYVSASLDMATRKLASVLKDGDGGEPAEAVLNQISTALENAREGTERVCVIVRDLKTFSRADEDRRVLVDVERVIDSTINLAWNQLKHRAKLVKDYGGVSAVWGDESRLGQVFLNLIVNAAQAIPEGNPKHHEIRITTRDADRSRVTVEIRDTGEGIPAEVVGRIFEPFFTTKPTGVGTGLGLSICHGIVTALGGDITVESQPDKGSTFRVTLAARSRRAGTPTHGHPRLTPAHGHRLTPAGGHRLAAAQSHRSTPTNGHLRAVAAEARSRILVIDDEPMVAKGLRAELREKHDVVIASDGSQALEILLSDDHFDLVLCDLSMPAPDGIAVYERVRRERPGLHERFAFITGGAFSDRARKFLAQSPNPRLEKPFRIAEVERLLRARR
jgi:PAS domain S-box-containing protein